MRIGSLCTGIAGLELGLQYAGIETKPVFVSDIDPGACDWLDQTMPHTPNLGDFTQLDELPECDILTAGFPCQPVSQAGLRKGINDDRWLFDDICRLVSRMDSRPVLFLENVPGILTANSGDAMGRVVHGLADIGYYITWGTLPASAVGAPHRRNRWWGLAYPSDSVVARPQKQRVTVPIEPQHSGAGSDRHATTDASGSGHTEGWEASDQDQLGRSARRGGGSAADTERIRNRSGQGSLKEDGTSLRVVGRGTTAADPVGERRQGRQAKPEHSDEQLSWERDMGTRFGRWAPAVARWEHILGRSAPDPHIEQRLNPAFVEWMMGYPEGWVTDTLTRRTHSLKALGNAVVPQCAAEAFLQLSTR